MRLSEKRCMFSAAHAELVLFISKMGYHAATDFVKRCRNCRVGMENSCHKVGLAADINIYDKDWNYLGDNHPDTIRIHNEAHDFWDFLGGAKRINRDLNHYSWGHEGVI